MQVLRPAGYNERRCIIRDALGLYGCIVTVATYSGSREIGKDDIIKVLKQCIIQHPVLCTAIKDGETERPQLVKCPKMDLSEHLRVLEPADAEDDHSKSLQRLLEQVHDEKLAGSHVRPQWCCYLVPLLATSSQSAPRFRLAFACSHGLMDGMSGIVFHTGFLRALQGLRKLEFDSESVWDIDTPTSQVLPALDRAAKFPISWSFLFGPFLPEYMPKFLASMFGFETRSSGEAWHGAARRPERSSVEQLVPTAVRVATVPHTSLQRALDVCKSHSTRLTGLLNQLIARALADTLQSRGQSYARFEVGTAIDLRKCIPNGRGGMANYVSVVNEVIDVEAKGFTAMTSDDWEKAKQSTERLSEASGTLCDQPIALLKYLPSFRAWIIERASKSANGSFEMSNLGSSELSSGEGEWQVKDMVFSQSADATGLPLSFNIANARGGPLSIVVTWWPGMLGVDDEGAFVEELCAKLVDQLAEIS